MPGPRRHHHGGRGWGGGGWGWGGGWNYPLVWPYAIPVAGDDEWLAYQEFLAQRRKKAQMSGLGAMPSGKTLLVIGGIVLAWYLLKKK